MWPSGGALATASVPTMPLAAGRLSTITDWPSARSRCGSIRRATVSLSPPGGNGTTMRTGRSGQVCATPGADPSMSISAPARAPHLLARRRDPMLDTTQPQRYNVYDRPHEDLREFVERAEGAGELMRVSGASPELEMGTLAEIVYHARPEPPAILF